MSTIREALERAMRRADDEASYRVYYEAKAALAELEALEAVAEAAREVSLIERTGTLPDFQPLADALAALDELDGQNSNAAVTNRESSACPCSVHGDPGDCGENCG